MSALLVILAFTTVMVVFWILTGTHHSGDLKAGVGCIGSVFAIMLLVFAAKAYGI